MQTHRVIGVLGGMGPAATVEFFRRLVARTPATIDRDHLRIVVDCDPTIPDRINALLRNGPSPVDALVRMAQGLVSVGAQVLSMPCNTAHAYVAELQKSVEVPFVDMVRETTLEIQESRVGLLATKATIKAGIYQRACEAVGASLVLPTRRDQETVVRAIDAVKAARSLSEVGGAIRSVVGRLLDGRAEATIVACTELSLLDGATMPGKWIDALDCLVQATLREAFRKDERS